MELAVTYEPVAWGVLAVGAAVAVYDLRYGLFLWILLAGTFLVPLVTVRSAAVYVSTAYLAILLALHAWAQWRERTLPVRQSALAPPLAVLALVAVLSCLQGLLFADPTTPGDHRFRSVQLYATALVLLSIGATTLVGSVVRGRDSIRWLWRVLVVAGAVIIVSIPLGLRINAPWWPILAAHLSVILFARLLYDPPASFWGRALALGLIVYVVAHVILVPFLTPHHGQWLSGWAMLVVPLGVVTVARLDSRLLWVLFCVTAGGSYLMFPYVYEIVFAARLEGDFGRFFIWEDALRIWRVRPLLGVGPGNYMDYAERYAQGPIAFASAHGNYQQLLAEMGIIGLGVFLWLIVRVFVLGSHLYRVTADPFLRSFVIATLATLCGQLLGCLLGDYILPAYHNGGHTNFCTTVYIWILLGVLVAVERESRPVS